MIKDRTCYKNTAIRKILRNRDVTSSLLWRFSDEWQSDLWTRRTANVITIQWHCHPFANRNPIF